MGTEMRHAVVDFAGIRDVAGFGNGVSKERRIS